MSSCPSLPTGPRLPCSVTMITQGDKSNEPPLQPRVRKVTTVINLLAVVVRDTPSELGVWLMSTSTEKKIPKTQPHMFAHCRLNTWLSVGVYPDGTLASFSPYAFSLHGHPSDILPTRQLTLTAKVKDLQFEKAITQRELIKSFLGGSMDDVYPYEEHEAYFYTLPGFGRILCHYDMSQISENSIWLEWCGDVVKEFRWCVNCITSVTENIFSEKELREASELIRNREINLEIPEGSDRIVARHYGLIIEVNVQRSFVSVWSPNVSMEVDHNAKIPPPKHKDAESPMLPPLVGQWIQFDIRSNDMVKYMANSSGSRILISEYLPITSPSGVGVLNYEKTVRIMVSCIVVTGTSHPYLYELPHFGFVLDRRASMVSGTHVQVVLEKSSSRIRKYSGVSWVVIESVQVDPECVTIEKLQNLEVQYVPLKDAMEISAVSNVERSVFPVSYTQNHSTGKPLNNPHTGVTNLKYQPPQHQSTYQENRRDSYYNGASIQMPNQHQNERGSHQYQKRKPLTYNGSTMEGTAIVEKIHSQMKSGVLWMFEAVISNVEEGDTNRTIPFTAHFLYNDDIELTVGDYVFVKLVQKQDPASNCGFRWIFVSAVKKQAPFQIQCKGFNQSILIYDVLAANGVDKLNRPVYSSKRFPNVIDVHNFIPNQATIPRFYGAITRKKIMNPVTEQTNFQWVLYAAPMYFVGQQFSVSRSTYSPRQYLHPVVSDVGRTTTLSDRSSASPPPLQSNAEEQ